MAEPAQTAVSDTHFQYLINALTWVNQRVEQAVARARAAGVPEHDEFRGLYISEEQVETLLTQQPGIALWQNGRLADTPAPWQTDTPNRLATLADAFSLATTDMQILLLALAPELDPRYERLYAYLQDDVTKKRPSVHLLLNLLTNNWPQQLACREHFTPASPLFQHQLLTLFDPPGQPEPPLLAQFVRPVPHLTDYLLGFTRLDGRLDTTAALLSEPTNTFATLPTFAFTQKSTESAEIEKHSQGNSWESWLFSKDSPLLLSETAVPPILSVIGGYGAGKNALAQTIAAQSKRPLLLIRAPQLTNVEEEFPLALRDGRLHGALLYLQKADVLLKDGRFPTHLFAQLINYPHTVIIGTTSAWQVRGGLRKRPLFTLHLAQPTYEARLAQWQQTVNAPANTIAALANQFRFTPGQINDAAATAHDLAQQNGRSHPNTNDLFAAARAHSNQKLAALATKIRPRYSWQDIVLPPDTLRQLQEMTATVRQRPTVYETWGFGRKLALGKGLYALFAGESGTGKTMSADIIANELGLDLYKIDLSTLVSKYIGETEKNLDRIFTEAATSNAILFFDEADAIFGKRSEVKDSHDRYANIEISYLLQRMEAYDGVVILATNLRANLDEAFTRRLHFAIEFPFPEPADRLRIWQVTFPADTPLANDVDFAYLASRFRLTGGNIRNIILAAAFLAADAQTAVSMSHLLHATRREYQKLGRLIDENLFAISD
ncbi:MAG: ATP-binding protein [Candidatus Promineifilaceae bacterium]